jgi:hypothetical protein
MFALNFLFIYIGQIMLVFLEDLDVDLYIPIVIVRNSIPQRHSGRLMTLVL